MSPIKARHANPLMRTAQDSSRPMGSLRVLTLPIDLNLSSLGGVKVSRRSFQLPSAKRAKRDSQGEHVDRSFADGISSALTPAEMIRMCKVCGNYIFFVHLLTSKSTPRLRGANTPRVSAPLMSAILNSTTKTLATTAITVRSYSVKFYI